ncbi:MAG: hypothetical protein RRA92_04600 [Gemmatimonadota bacterium]|nr:hypothetical protein [Gemmatimonadota bacterium]
MRRVRWTAAPGSSVATGSHAGCLAAMALAVAALAAPSPSGAQEPAAADRGADSAAAPARSQDDAFARLAAEAGRVESGAFPFDFQHLCFYPGTPDSVEMVTAASVHAGRVRGVFDGGWKYELALRIELSRDGVPVASGESRVRHVLNRLIPPSTTDGFPLQASVVVPPGEYDYRIEVRDLNWNEGRSVNVREGHITIPSFEVGEAPLVSSVAVAADSGGSWTPAPGVNLKLNAARMVQTDARPYVYFETYGLTPGAPYRGEVRLVSTWRPDGSGERFEGVWQPFQLQYRGTAPDESGEPARSVLRLDMKDTRPGPYEVQVRVTDTVTGRRSAVRTAGIRVREPEQRGPEVPVTEVGPGRSDGDAPDPDVDDAPREDGT